MTTNTPEVVAVVGATGAQGGGLVDALLADSQGGFAPRALTRDPDSEAAKALSDRGVEVVRADLNDRGSLEEAFAGAYGAFCVTNFWELFDPKAEMAQAKNLAEACARAGVQHAIWSTLEDTREFVPLSDDRMPTLLGRYKVPHFDGKGEANSYFADAGVPTTYLLASFYWENFIFFGLGPKPGPEGVLTLTIPMADAPLAGISAEDIGPCAYGLFKTEAIGETVGIAGEHLTGPEMATKMSRSLNREVRYEPVTPDTFRSFGFPGAEDLGNMFQFYAEYAQALGTARSVTATRELHPGTLDFDGWLDRKGALIPLE
jgi:uncharacterized protein YbjT (DUF2867 family)